MPVPFLVTFTLLPVIAPLMVLLPELETYIVPPVDNLIAPAFSVPDVEVKLVRDELDPIALAKETLPILPAESTILVVMEVFRLSTAPTKLILAPLGAEPPLVLSKIVEPANVTGPLKV